MTNGRITIWTLLLMLFITLLPASAAEQQDRITLQTRLSRNKVAQGENLIYEVILFTPDPEVEGVELMGYPQFEGAEVRRSSADSRLTGVRINGKPMYRAVIDRYFLHFPESGKFNVKGGDYKIGLLTTQEYYDPFRGRVLGRTVKPLTLSAPDAAVKVTSLPQKGRPEDFSGAVGDFEISADFRDRVLKNDEDAILRITISGIGSLQGALLPDVRSMLPDGLQFKSMTDNVSHYVKEGEIGSELEIICVVMPKREGKLVIDSLSFNFFNSQSGRYEKITAPVLEVEVENGLPGSGKPSVIMEI